jgi:hypothetical protein
MIFMLGLGFEDRARGPIKNPSTPEYSTPFDYNKNTF